MRSMSLASVVLVGALILLRAPSPVGAADGDADDKAIRDLPQRYFTAFAAKDLDAFMALWSEKSPDYEARKKTMTRLFAETGPIELKSLTVVRVRRDGDAATVRVRVELAATDIKTGKPHPSFGVLDRVLDLAREAGGWKVMRYVSSDRRLMDLLAAAKTKEERLRLLDGDSDLVGPDFVIMVLDEENAQARRGRFDQASGLQDVAFEVAVGLGDRNGLARCHLYRGMVLELRSRYEPALASYQKALALFREANDRKGEGSTLDRIGLVYYDRGLYVEALRQYQDSLKIQHDLGDRIGEAVASTDIGNVYMATGRYPEALRQYQDSLKIARDLENRAAEAHTLNNIGVVYEKTGRYREALRQYEDSLKIARDLGDRAGEARTLGNIGLVYQSTGRYGEALRQLQDSLKIEHDLGNRKEEATALNNIGLVYQSTGRYEEALRQYIDSLKIQSDLGDRAGAAGTISNLGNVYDKLGRHEDALKQYQISLKIKRHLGDRAGEAKALNNIGVIYDKTGNHAEALRQYQDSLKIEQDLGDLPGEASTRNNIGSVYREMDRNGEAKLMFVESLRIAQSIEDLSGASLCHENLGRMYQAQKQWREAEQAFRDAVDDVERARTNTHEPLLQTSLLAQKTYLFLHLAECLLELSEPAKAFASCEQMKARGLVDMLRDGKADLRRGMSNEERKEEQKLQDGLTALGVELENLRSKKADLDRQTVLADELKKARQDYEAFRRDLFLHRPDLQTRRAEFAPASPDDLGAALFVGRPGLVVLSYLVGDKETLLFVLTAGEKDGGPARLTVHRIDVGSKDLVEAVGAFRDACSDPGKGEQDSDDFYRWLLAPAADELADAKQLVVVPDGVLHTLPFQALKDADGKYLIERFPVSYAPSVTALTKMAELGAKRRKQYAGQPPSLLAVGVSDFGRRERPLPAAEKEAKAVADAFGDGAKLLPGAEATRAKLAASWSGRRYLHFATHGRLNPDVPLYSSLVLSSSGDGDEGVLYARDLVDGAEIPAELAVMSACQTGLGRHVSGEGLQGMSWSWFTAGVPSTVASQWSVGDDSTARLMKVFYARLNAGDSKADALRQAELTLLKDDATRHPFYWAPFVLVGDDR